MAITWLANDSQRQTGSATSQDITSQMQLVRVVYEASGTHHKEVSGVGVGHNHGDNITPPNSP